ncbi:MAG: 3-oxoacid CoA-transferase subunit B [Firmicutes bacterium]|nr:3-oxoacid CoA-transferase subunit B [Bacillota bacterium]
MVDRKREIIARRIAREFKDGDVVNLGIGLPTVVAEYIPQEIEIVLHSENGFVGLGPAPEPGREDPDLVNAGAQPVTIKTGGAVFDSVLSFSIIRGGHVDTTVLGALEVDEKGNIASWMIPGKLVPGMGGAMDLLEGAKRVIVAMEHVAKDGTPKILKRCRLPLTAVGAVEMIVTEMGVLEVTPEGLLLTEVAPGLTVEVVQAVTEATLIVAPFLREMTA